MQCAARAANTCGMSSSMVTGASREPRGRGHEPSQVVLPRRRQAGLLQRQWGPHVALMCSCSCHIPCRIFVLCCFLRLSCIITSHTRRHRSSLNPDLTPTAMLATWLPCSSSDGGFSTTTVCRSFPPAVADGAGTPTAGPAGVTVWHTAHWMLLALTGCISMMWQPVHTTWLKRGTGVTVWHDEHCTLSAPRG